MERLTQDLQTELMPLLHELHQEVGEFADWPIKMDWMPYQYAQEMGNLLLVTARDNGALKGFLAFLVMDHPHYGVKFGRQDCIYLAPELRGKMTAVRMYKYAEKKLKLMGAKAFTTHTRTGNFFFGGLLEALGCHITEMTYTKRL